MDAYQLYINVLRVLASGAMVLGFMLAIYAAIQWTKEKK